jgi:D12 class N6 adenine-specific DNA methyltransferase
MIGAWWGIATTEGYMQTTTIASRKPQGTSKTLAANTGKMRIFNSALPAYLGGKRKLAPLAVALLLELFPEIDVGATVFQDPFCGGCGMALYAKALGFEVLASDIAERAFVTATALIANSAVRLRWEDILDFYREPAAPFAQIAAGYVPGVFAAEQAHWLDRFVARANARPEPTRSLLRLLIIKLALRCQPMSMLRGTDARAASDGDFDRVSPRRLGHYLKAQTLFTPKRVWSIAEEINAGVIGGHGTAGKLTVLEALARTTADVVYLDPPYPGTTRYEREYAPLDVLLGDVDLPAEPISIPALLDAAHEAKVVVLSYGGPTTTLEGLVTLVARHRLVVHALAISYAHLRSIATEKKNETNREYLIVAGR